MRWKRETEAEEEEEWAMAMAMARYTVLLLHVRSAMFVLVRQFRGADRAVLCGRCGLSIKLVSIDCDWDELGDAENTRKMLFEVRILYQMLHFFLMMLVAMMLSSSRLDVTKTDCPSTFGFICFGHSSRRNARSS